MIGVPFNCVYCESSFTTNKALNIHLSKIHHEDKEYHCSTCCLQFSKASDLKKHAPVCSTRCLFFTDEIQERKIRELKIYYENKFQEFKQQIDKYINQ